MNLNSCVWLLATILTASCSLERSLEGPLHLVGGMMGVSLSANALTLMRNEAKKSINAIFPLGNYGTAPSRGAGVCCQLSLTYKPKSR